MSLPTPLITYPRSNINKSNIKDYYDTPEEEVEATKLYFKLNPPCSKQAVYKFVMDYHSGLTSTGAEETFGRNTMIDTIAELDPYQFGLACWGYDSLFKTTDKEKIRLVGQNLHRLGGMDVMRASYYLLCWDTQKGGDCIRGWKRMIEFYWDGIGDWRC